MLIKRTPRALALHRVLVQRLGPLELVILLAAGFINSECSCLSLCDQQFMNDTKEICQCPRLVHLGFCGFTSSVTLDWELPFHQFVVFCYNLLLFVSPILEIFNPGIEEAKFRIITKICLLINCTLCQGAIVQSLKLTEEERDDMGIKKQWVLKSGSSFPATSHSAGFMSLGSEPVIPSAAHRSP